MIYVITDTHGTDLLDVPTDCTTLIHLGDYETGLLPDCYKILVRGNHDNKDSEEEFDLVVDGLMLDHIWFTHEPAFSLPLGAHYNAHGHLHENNYQDYGYINKPFHIRLTPHVFYNLPELCDRMK